MSKYLGTVRAHKVIDHIVVGDYSVKNNNFNYAADGQGW
jgi:hypothetical protein